MLIYNKTEHVSMPQYANVVFASSVSRSPDTAIGIAGGQETDGCASTRPTQSETETVSHGDSMASLGVQTVCRRGMAGGASVMGSRRGIAHNVSVRTVSVFSDVCGVSIRTT